MSISISTNLGALSSARNLASTAVSQATQQKLKAAAQNSGPDQNAVLQAFQKATHETAAVTSAQTSADGSSLYVNTKNTQWAATTREINAAISANAHYTGQQLADAINKKAASSYQSAQSLTAAPSQALKLFK